MANKSLMSKIMLLAAIVLIATESFAQAPAAPPPPTANVPGAADAKGATQAPQSTSSLSTFMEPFDYDPLGRKDPFQKPAVERPAAPGSFHGPLLPLQKYALSDLTLIGIIWDVTKPRAMFKDKNGQVHVVGPNARIGNQNGYVAVIREGEVVVIETYEEDGKLYSAARIVKLAEKDEKTARR